MSNVVFIICDEMTRSALGCYGNTSAHTPNLDKLAKEGVCFTRAITPSPICISARSSLATGLAVHEHQDWSSAQAFDGALPTWMGRLRAQDVDVVSIGKLHFKSPDNDHGFSEERLAMYVANNGIGWAEALLRDPMPEYRGAPELAADIGPGGSSYSDYDHKIIADAKQWLDNRASDDNQKNPFVLSVSLVSPHYPLNAPQKYFDLVAEADIPAPIQVEENHPVLQQMRKFWAYDDHFDEQSRHQARRNYWALCAMIDVMVGQLVVSLEVNGFAEDTTIIFTSDHGEILGNRGWWCKSVMYEDSVGVPMIINGPALQGITGNNNTNVNLTDVGATIEHALLGHSNRPEKPWQATSMLNLAQQPDSLRPVLSQYHDGGSPTGFALIQKGSHKLTRYAGNWPEQLFDVATDPNEENDLAGIDTNTQQDLGGILELMLDLEAANKQAFASQKQTLEELGGEAALDKLRAFNHTPVEL